MTPSRSPPHSSSGSGGGVLWHQSQSRPATELWAALTLAPNNSLYDKKASVAILNSSPEVHRILVTFSQFNSQSLSSLNLDCAYCKIYLRHTLYKPLWWNNCTYVPLLWWTIIAYGLLLTSMWLSSLVWLVSTVYSQWKWGEVFYFDFSCGLSKYTGCRWSGFFRRQIKWNSFSAPWQDLWPSWYKVANSLCVFY